MTYTVVLLPILSVLSIAHDNYLQPNQNCPAVFMRTNHDCMVRTYNNEEVVIIKAENNDTIYMMQAPKDQSLHKDFALIEYLKNINEQNCMWSGDYEDVQFPMVDINE